MPGPVSDACDGPGGMTTDEALELLGRTLQSDDNDAHAALDLLGQVLKQGTTRCAFCGVPYPGEHYPDAKQLAKHVRICIAHPMRRLEIAVGTLLLRLERIRDAELDAVTYVESCIKEARVRVNWAEMAFRRLIIQVDGGDDKLYVIASVLAPPGMEYDEAERLIVKLWPEFQASEHNADSEFDEFLEEHGGFVSDPDSHVLMTLES